MVVTSGPDRARAGGLGLLQVSAAGVLWGTGGLAVTLLHERDGLGAMTVSAWRMLLAAVALAGFAALTRRTATARELLRRRPGRTIAVGCGTAAYQGLYFVSVLLAGVSVATVVSLGLAPILAAVHEHVRAGTRPALRQVAVLLAALIGLVLISVTAGHGTGGGDSPYLGLALAVAAGITYAATTVLGHSLARRTDPVTLTTCTTTVGAVALAPFLVIAAVAGQPAAGTSLPSLALLAYLGLATMALAYGLLYAGLRTTSGSAATIATLLEPVAAALLAATLLHERLPWPAVVGGVLILAAVAALRPARRG
ncbi:membrane protein [Paractinoplanes abujensis]|uniref:DME family drug/metabolite transporter n=1 Tax=Paractinoplanes abujensis TaxID=882441 RepID=A0A7W7G262_9ACTN|nr:EamA family transporter [Actinoplanes abujensis]MBB4692830.1 DME family drug/metabolite transporter [Actinoplanes abujensis]GID22671.1 membrane protein [Actinoplanes abujensis]